MSIRKPGWAAGASLMVNGQVVEAADGAGDEGGYAVVRRAWGSHDALEVVFAADLRLETRDKKSMTLDAMGADVVEAALWYGPYLLSAQSSSDAAFFAEPWANNVVYLSDGMAATPGQDKERPFAIPGSCFVASYLHEGSTEPSQVVLRPMSDCMQDDQNTIAVWLRYQRK